MKKFIIFIASVLMLSACSDFLNIRPEGTTTSTGIDYTKAENIFKPVRRWVRACVILKRTLLKCGRRNTVVTWGSR